MAVSVQSSVADETGIIVYPDSDGKPMAEDDPQYRSIVETRFALEQFYRQNDQVYVGADLLIYYEPGDTGENVAPDVFLALGVPRRVRRTYLVWAEGKAPALVFEFASPSSWRADLSWKLGLYQGLGVREYILLDPSGEYFEPLLQGYRLDGAFYKPIALLEGERGSHGLASEVLQLEIWSRLQDVAGMPFVLRLYDPATGAWLPTTDEEAEARRAAEARVRMAALQAELERLRAGGRYAPAGRKAAQKNAFAALRLCVRINY